LKQRFVFRVCLQNRFGLVSFLLRSVPLEWFVCYMISCIFGDSLCPLIVPASTSPEPLSSACSAQSLQRELISPADPL
jgi:hypothetical protein